MLKFFILLTVLFLTACGVLSYEPFVDATEDANGNIIILDTPRMWKDSKEAYDLQIADEVAGRHAPGIHSWNQHWLSIIANISDGSQQNPQKYINYIIESRRAAGLPELVGYP